MVSSTCLFCPWTNTLFAPVTGLCLQLSSPFYGHKQTHCPPVVLSPFNKTVIVSFLQVWPNCCGPGAQPSPGLLGCFCLPQGHCPQPTTGLLHVRRVARWSWPWSPALPWLAARLQRGSSKGSSFMSLIFFRDLGDGSRCSFMVCYLHPSLWNDSYKEEQQQLIQHSKDGEQQQLCVFLCLLLSPLESDT